jgi:arginyl-tRNA synthetase
MKAISFSQEIAAALEKTDARSLGEEKIQQLLEVPPTPELGDYAFPCFSLSKELKKSPKGIAEVVQKQLKLPSFVEKTSVAGPYVNFFLKQSILAEQTITAVLSEKNKYGVFRKKKGKKIMVEYFHANTHKAVHIGHIRNICLGESICRLLEATGNKVIRVDYGGDIGMHVAKCLWGYFKEKENLPAAHRGIWLSHVYKKAHKQFEADEGIANEIKEINSKLYAKDKSVLKAWKETRKMCFDDFDELYKDFRVKFDRFYWESEVEDAGKKFVLANMKKGVFSKSEGAIIADLKEQGMGVTVLISGEGNPLYHGKEFGLKLLKQKEYSDIDQSLHLVGKEQELYFNQFFKMLELLKDPFAAISTHVIYDLVMLPEGKMSSREGTVVFYEDLIVKLKSFAEGEINKRHPAWKETQVEKTAKALSFAALKFSMLSVENNKRMLFDWKKSLDFEGETGPYVLYAYVRAQSILKQAKKSGGKVDYKNLSLPEEKALVTMIADLENKVVQASRNHSPHTIVHYLLALAGAFNSYYHKVSVLKADTPKQVAARLALTQAVAQTLKNGLELVNIPVIEEM